MDLVSPLAVAVVGVAAVCLVRKMELLLKWAAAVEKEFED